MKRLRKVLSLLLVGVIAVTSLFCGTVTASAEANPKLIVNGFFNTDGLFCVRLDGIGKDEMKAATDATASNIMINMSADIIFGNNVNLNCVYNVIGNSLTFIIDYSTDSKGTKLELKYNSRMYDNTSVGGDLGFVWFLDPNIPGEADLIRDLIRETGANVGFGTIEWKSGEKNLKGYYDSSNTYWLNNTSAEWDLSNKPKSFDTDRWVTISDDMENGDEIILRAPTKEISSLSFSSLSSKAYTGKAIKPAVTIKDGTETLTKGTDYTVSYKNNTNIGKATVTIKGKGIYTGTKTLTFKIIPAKTTLTAKKSSSGYTLSWKKVSGIDKYQIQYSTDGGKTYKSGGTAASGKTSKILKLGSGSSYTFRIRSYKVVDGKKYYSSWSKAAAVK